jgi:hypothetical protein
MPPQPQRITAASPGRKCPNEGSHQLARTAAHECEPLHLSQSLDAARDCLQAVFLFAPVLAPSVTGLDVVQHLGQWHCDTQSVAACRCHARRASIADARPHPPPAENHARGNALVRRARPADLLRGLSLGHSIAISADRWPDDVRLSDPEARFACRACGKRGADVRPNFNARGPAGGMGYRVVADA